MLSFLTRPTPASVKRLAAVLRVSGPLRWLKLWIRPAVEGVAMQLAIVVGQLPSRKLRHAAYRLMGMQIGPGALIHRGLEVRDPRQVVVGEGSVVGFDVILDARRGVRIGRYVNISSSVAIWTMQHDYRDPGFGVVGAGVVIGDRAWLSFRATVLPGITIGQGAIVAAGAVVTRDVADYTVVAGVPARVVAERPRALDYDLRTGDAAWFV